NWSSMDRCYLQAEAGIRYFHVTGVQTCALPISGSMPTAIPADSVGLVSPKVEHFAEPLALACGRTLGAYQLIYETYGELNAARKIGRASCRESVKLHVGDNTFHTVLQQDKTRDR